MARDSTKKRFGEMPCEGMNCKSHEKHRPVIVYVNSKGTLAYTCDCCGRSRWAKEGNEDYLDWMQDITKYSPDDVPVVAAPAKPKPAPAAPAPAPKPEEKPATGKKSFNPLDLGTF